MSQYPMPTYGCYPYSLDWRRFREQHRIYELARMHWSRRQFNEHDLYGPCGETFCVCGDCPTDDAALVFASSEYLAKHPEVIVYSPSMEDR